MRSHKLHRIAVVVLNLLFGFTALGQVEHLPAAGSTDQPYHGWVIVTDPGQAGSALAHIPPRGPSAHAAPAPDGKIKGFGPLGVPPEALASEGSSVYLLFEPNLDGSRRVGQIEAVPAGIRDLWLRVPEGRLRILQAVPDARNLLGFTGYQHEIWALLARATGPVLLLLEPKGWVEQALPDLGSGDPLLFSSELGLHLVVKASDGWSLWTRRDDGWDSDKLAGPMPGEGSRVVGVWRGEVVVLDPIDERHDEVISISPGGQIRLGQVVHPAQPTAATILHGPGRLMLVWTEAGAATSATESALPTPGLTLPVQQVVEFDLVSGTLIYSGPAVVQSPVSEEEFRFLALGLLLLMAVVLLVVLRPTPDEGEIVLPEGLAFASPGQRLVATALDGMIGVLLSGQMFGLSVSEVLGPLAVPLTGRLDVLPLVIALTINVLHCSLSEAMFGRSFGKAMMGLIVSRVDAGNASLPRGQFRPPTLMRSLGRNLIKWYLPPVAMLALTDPSGRHRGDVLARSAVLTRAGPPLSDDDHPPE